MPAYNVGEYIDRSISSVLSQVYENWELLVIDDGSTDDTGKKIAKYSDPRIKVYSQFNQGVSVARNQGMGKITGEYFAFLDADDVYHELFLETMISAITSSKADLVFCKYRKVFGEKILEETPQEVKKLPDNSFIKYLLSVKKNPYAVMASLYRTDSVLSLGIFFTPDCILGEDSEFILKVSAMSKTVFVAEYLYTYVYRKDSASHQELTYKHLSDYYNSYNRVRAYINNLKTKDIYLYSKYLDKTQNGIINNLKRKLWADMRKGNFDEIDRQLCFHGNLKLKSNNIIQAISNSFKLAVINSRNRNIWRIFKK